MVPSTILYGQLKPSWALTVCERIIRLTISIKTNENLLIMLFIKDYRDKINKKKAKKHTFGQ